MMKKSELNGVSRRSFLKSSAAAGGAIAAASFIPTRFAVGAGAPIKVGILLPYSGTYAMLGNSITDAFKLRIEQNGGMIAGREIEYVPIDSEMSVPKAPNNTNKLVSKDKVDFVVGPVHSGIAAVMAKIVGKRKAPIMIVPNAGSNAVTGPLCAPNIFRTSFSNWQAAYPGGKMMANDGHKTAVTISWKYGAGRQMMDAGAESFVAAGGKIIKDIEVPFPDVEFQAHLSEIASLQPDAVFSFFSGGGAVKFVKEFAAAGLKDNIALYGPGFLTEGVNKAQGAAAEGIKTSLHYVTGLDNPANKAFTAAYTKAYGKGPNVFSVQGWDAAELMIMGLNAVKGDTSATAQMIDAMAAAELKDSPRGAWRMSKAHNPIQNIYAREVVNGDHKILGIAAADLEDRATGCKMA
jgi:branched-chain amino acid transport system substrate-binding protein